MGLACAVGEHPNGFVSVLGATVRDERQLRVTLKPPPFDRFDNFISFAWNKMGEMTPEGCTIGFVVSS